jgi:hypothetical protein
VCAYWEIWRLGSTAQTNFTAKKNNKRHRKCLSGLFDLSAFRAESARRLSSGFTANTELLVGDPDASAYELLFSFSSPEEKNEFLNLVRSNKDMGNDYIYIIELTPPTTEEIRNARPLATVLPQDALTHAMLIAVTLCARTEDDRAVS